MSEPFDANAYLRCDCATTPNQTCDKCAVRGHIAALREALQPFRDFAHVSADANGWINRAGNERISDWFGPSDFFRAFTVYGADAPHDVTANRTSSGKPVEQRNK